MTNDYLAARVARTCLGGALLACWRAAAYDRPDERTMTGWTKLALAVTGLAFALTVGATLAVGGLAPRSGPEAVAIDAALEVVAAANLVLGSLMLMYLGKLLTLVVREVR